MPNYVFNKLTVSGPAGEVRAFCWKAWGSEKIPLEANNFIPMPEEIRTTEAPNRNATQAQELYRQYGASDWREWSIKNWGTKWGAIADGECREIDENELQYEFCTANSPFNEHLMQRMSKEFPGLSLNLDYREYETGFYGAIAANAGRITPSGTYHVDEMPEDAEQEDQEETL